MASRSIYEKGLELLNSFEFCPSHVSMSKIIDRELSKGREEAAGAKEEERDQIPIIEEEQRSVISSKRTHLSNARILSH